MTEKEVYSNYAKMREVTTKGMEKKNCSFFKNQSKGNVQINCSGLYVKGEPFVLRGVGYQPIPIGKDGKNITHRQEMYNDARIYRDRDFPLIREMNANGIRVWSEVMNETFLDSAWNGGVNPLYVVMGFWINCNEDYSNSAIRQKYIDSFKDYVTKYKDHPAVLAWAIGNENNLPYCSYSSRLPHFYSLANELAKTAYEIEGESYHPVGVVNGDLGYLGIKSYNSDDSSLTYIDFWGMNVFPGETFGYWFDEYSLYTGKPLLITEYGIDAYDNINKKEYETTQSLWTIRQWREINSSKITIGSSVMEYSDEWWKAWSPTTQDYGGYLSPRHPDGYSNEEWWGIVRVKKNNSAGAIDIVEKRKIFFDFKTLWAKEGMYGDLNKDCKIDISDLAIVGKNYGFSGDDNWDKRADLNSDGKVNIIDLAIIGQYFGKKC
jgi:hypothetical protein